MMGLEPTTFCMANGSWVRPGGAAIALFMRRSANTMRVASRTNAARFQAIRDDLGTNIEPVPNLKTRRSSRPQSEERAQELDLEDAVQPAV